MEKKLGGKRALLDLGDTKVHTLLDLYKKKHFDDAWTAYVYSHPEVIDQSRIKQLQKQQTYQGNYGAAVEAAEALQMYIVIMALCHNCDEVRDEYVGNGVQKEYEITFEYYDQDDVAVAILE